MSTQDLIEYCCEAIDFAPEHRVTVRAKELLRLMQGKMLNTVRDGDNFSHILAIDLACRELNTIQGRKKLKELAKVTLEKYMNSLKSMKSMLGLKFQSGVTFEELDLMFGGGSLATAAKDVLERFKCSGKVNTAQYLQDEAAYMACAFVEAGKHKVDAFLPGLLEHIEITPAQYKKVKLIFKHALDSATSGSSTPGMRSGVGQRFNVSAADSSMAIGGKVGDSRGSSKAATARSSSYDELRETVTKQNRELDPTNNKRRLSSNDTLQVLDLQYLNDVDSSEAVSKQSSKRAISMAGGIDHFRSNIKADVAENEMQQKRKLLRRSEYDNWKAAFIVAVKKKQLNNSSHA